MTIRLALPPGRLRPRLSAAVIREVCGIPCNDNGRDDQSDALLHAALRHFAEHGLAAAHRARKQAEAAFFAGDRQGYAWWLEICRALDRRMAQDLGTAMAEEVAPASSDLGSI
ncbi:MAG: hypothetical protein J7493_01410 [Porphyrobacter sp.]|nr:hypothetical protein [Porphyrobacter sp.]